METGVVVVLIIALWSGACSDLALASSPVTIGHKMETEMFNFIHHATGVYNKIQSDENALRALKKSVQDELISKNSHYLGNILCGGEAPGDRRRVKELADLYKEHYEPKLTDDILRGAIEEAVSCKSVQATADSVWYLLGDGDRDQFELLVRLQMLLIAKHLDVADTKVRRKLAYSLHRIKEHKLYPSIEDSLRESVNELITKLPTNLQYLMFYNHFCLMNAKYFEYAYTAMNSKNLDYTSRYVWTWFEKWSIDDTGHIKANVFERVTGNTTDHVVQLSGTKYQVFYYMMPETKMIAAWDMPSEPLNSFWSVELIDGDRVTLQQQGHIMCAVEEKWDKERRLLMGYKNELYSSKSSECQWLLGACKRD